MKKRLAKFLLPVVAEVFTRLPYTEKRSRFMDLLIELSEGPNEKRSGRGGA